MSKLILASLMIIPTGFPQDADVENPAYARWSGFKPNSWVTFEQPWGRDGVRQETEKLVRISKENVVLECAIVENGQPFPVFEKVIPSTIKANAKNPEYVEARRPEGGSVVFDGPGGKTKVSWRTSAEGDEELKAGGQKLNCHWAKKDHQMESAFEAANYKGSVKTWTSKEIPGGVAQLEMTRFLSGDQPQTIVVTRILKAWRKE